VSIPDISNNNAAAASENWAAVKAAGTDAGACKASEGTGFIDRTFGPNWTQMHDAGITARIPYHFAHPGQDPVANAATYVRSVQWGMTSGGPLGAEDRRACDMEVYEGRTPTQVVNWALQWEAASRSLGGAKPLFYTYSSYLSWLGAAAAPLVGVFDLWLASYGSKTPSAAPWPSWVLWQYSDSGSLSGINGHVDLSRVGPGFFKGRPAAANVTPGVNGMNASIVGGALNPSGDGYRLVGGDGGIFDFQAPFLGSTGALKLNAPIVGMAVTPTGLGYWLTGADGGIFCFGDAPFLGGLGGTALNAPIVAICPSPDGKGYWLAAKDGGIFTFGDAPFAGSLGGDNVTDVVAMAPRPGGGYFLCGADGGVFTLQAPFYGSAGATHLNAPVVGMAATPTGGGYWLVGADGGVFSYGDATYLGGLGAVHLNAPIVGMDSTPSGQGYFLWAGDGGVFCFGDASFQGSI
jgi:GH25 family lysozyme M1 (1,4-beta-N-acetylmuramidase)